MNTALRRFMPALVLLLGALLYWPVSLDHLSSWPPVGEDEPWIAAAPYKLATQGVYGNDLFAGYYNSEQHLYNLVPLYPMMLSGVFRTAGIGVEQMRILPVAFGFLLLLILYLLARQLFDSSVATLSVALMLLLRLTSSLTGTGIPLLDIARINRPDLLVSLFGLFACYLFNRAEQRNSRSGYLVAGMMIGLAALADLYGAFWLPALLVLLPLRRGWRIVRGPEPYLLLAGFCATWLLPLAVYLIPGWDDYRGQSQIFAERFDLFTPRFYLRNLLHEFERFRVLGLIRRSGRIDWVRPGGWVALAALPIALWMMLRQGWMSRQEGAFSLGVILLVQSILFALLLSSKSFNYFIALWPLAVVAIAWLGMWLWKRWRNLSIRIPLLTLLALLVIEGGVRMVANHIAAVGATPYELYESRVAEHIPEGSRLLGLQHYWLGLRQYDYRSWVLPVFLSKPGYHQEPVSLDSAIERIAPDVILIDRHMRDYFREISDSSNPDHHKYEEFRSYMRRRAGNLAGTVDDSTYGRMEIYTVAGSRGMK
jgi:4-amino-4-deoxy-L-arabinose transferase-like glycosyltransferase